MTQQWDYDVIIVGGRVSGSTLAAYLGQAGVRVLILERARLPEPHPASSPIIQPATMSMLDEIGADESAYARGTPPIRRMLAVDGDIKFELDIPEIDGRNYAYAIDRARFDAALWDNAVRSPSVEGRMGFSVTNLLWDDEGKRVIGITGTDLDKREKHTFTARCVVGADGRFSMVARKADAQELNRHDEHPTTLYYAYWRGIRPYDNGGATSIAYGSQDNTHGYLVMDSADDTTAVVIEGRSDVIAPEAGETESFYMDKLRENPQVWGRVKDGEMVSKVHGMRQVGNMYRKPGGPGWALTGDAYHQKDPIDGQGIYDAVYISRTLAKALVAWHEGRTRWADALKWYDKTARAQTQPQFESTLNRVQQQLYPPLNIPIPKKLLQMPARWLSKDPQYQRLAGLSLNRQVSPKKSLEPRFLALAMLRGSLRELSERLDTPAETGQAR